MSVLTSGRTELSCRDNVGGVKNVYIFSYNPNTQFLLDGQNLISSDNTDSIYKFDVTNGNFNESITNDENGVLFRQNLSFRLLKQDLFTTKELNDLTNFDFRYVVEFNSGVLKLCGLYNAAKVSSLTVNSGGTKQDFTGYDISFESAEEIESIYLSDLSLLTPQSINYIFENNDNFIFQNGINYIFN